MACATCRRAGYGARVLSFDAVFRRILPLRHARWREDLWQGRAARHAVGAWETGRRDRLRHSGAHWLRYLLADNAPRSRRYPAERRKRQNAISVNITSLSYRLSGFLRRRQTSPTQSAAARAARGSGRASNDSGAPRSRGLRLFAALQRTGFAGGRRAAFPAACLDARARHCGICSRATYIPAPCAETVPLLPLLYAAWTSLTPSGILGGYGAYLGSTAGGDWRAGRAESGRSAAAAPVAPCPAGSGATYRSCPVPALSWFASSPIQPLMRTWLYHWASVVLVAVYHGRSGAARPGFGAGGGGTFGERG